MRSTLPERMRALDGSDMKPADPARRSPGSHGLTTQSERGTVELLDRIGDEWRELCQEGACNQPFFRPEWIASSIKAFAGERPVCMITVSDGGRMRSVLPQLDDKDWACVHPATKLRSAADHTPRFDFIHGKGPSLDEALQAGWKELKNQHRWDRPSNSGMCRREERLVSDFSPAATEDGFLTYRRQCAQSPYIPLNGNKPGKDFSQFALSSRFRYRLRHFLAGSWKKPETFLCAGWRLPIRRLFSSSTVWKRVGGKAREEPPLHATRRRASSMIPSPSMPRSMVTCLFISCSKVIRFWPRTSASLVAGDIIRSKLLTMNSTANTDRDI